MPKPCIKCLSYKALQLPNTVPKNANNTAFNPPADLSLLDESEKNMHPAKTQAIPMPWIKLGISENIKTAPINVQNGPEARMGAAHVIGRVLSARYVAVQLAPTIKLLITKSNTFLGAISKAAVIRPEKIRISDKTAQPLNVVKNKVGNTELFLTLAFLHKSYMLKHTLELKIHKSQESTAILKLSIYAGSTATNHLFDISLSRH